MRSWNLFFCNIRCRGPLRFTPPPWLYVYLGKIFFKSGIIFIGLCNCNSFRCCYVLFVTSCFCQGCCYYRKNTVFLRKTKGYLSLLAGIERNYVTGKWQLYLFSCFRERIPKDQTGKANLWSTSPQEEVHTEVSGQLIVLLYS